MRSCRKLHSGLSELVFAVTNDSPKASSPCCGSSRAEIKEQLFPVTFLRVSFYSLVSITQFPGDKGNFCDFISLSNRCCVGYEQSSKKCERNKSFLFLYNLIKARLAVLMEVQGDYVLEKGMRQS